MKGIMCIIDIMDENPNLLEWEKAKQKHYFSMFFNLSWLDLIKSSPILGIVFLVDLQEPNYRMKI